MAPWALRELEALVEREVPEGVQITSSRYAETNIVLCMSIPTTIAYSQIEALRQGWERASGWRIAIDTFYYSPDVDAQLIATVLRLAPNQTDIKAIVTDERRIIIYSLDVTRLYGRDNRVFARFRTALRSRTVSFQAADKRYRSTNLDTVDHAITRTLNCQGVLGQTRNLVPPEFHLRTVAMDVPSRTLIIRYGTPRVTPEQLRLARTAITSATGWNVRFRKLVDSTSIMDQVKQQLPQTLPRTDIGFNKEEEYVLLECFGDVTHEPILTAFTERLSRELPVEVRYRLKLNDARKAEILHDLIPVEWGFQRAYFNEKERTATINCTTPPPADDPAAQRVIEAVSERLGRRIFLLGNEYERVTDERQIAEVKKVVPAPCGFDHLARNAVHGDYRLYVRRNPQHVKIRDLRRILKVKAVTIKVAKAAIERSPYVNAVLSVTDPEALPRFVRVRSRKYGRIVGFGACEEVGRSSFYFELSGLRILVDCGASFGPDPYPALPRQLIQKLDYVFLSHAHTDHSALIPWLYKQGCTAQLIATEPTLVIARVLQEDYLKVQKNYRHETPAYKKEDIEHALSQACIVNFDQRYQIGENTYFTFLNSGHILGSAMILFEDGDERILYSGDLTFRDSRVLVHAELPERLDHVVIETTYGGRQHRDRQESEQYFLRRIEETLENGGTVIIPSFAVGRAQEILTILSQHPKLGYSRGFPVYVDGMILAINDIHRAYLSVEDEVYLNPRLKAEEKNIFTGGTSFFSPITRREAVLADRNPKVILSTSGMCEGLAAYYLSAFIEDPKNLLMFVGYQAQGNLGRLIQDGAERVNIDGKLLTVRIQVDTVGFSGHADQEQILRALGRNRLKHLLTVHGDSPAMASFTQAAQRCVRADSVAKMELNKEVMLYQP